MDHLEHNRIAWNHASANDGRWSTPVDSEVIRDARQGQWEVVLTPSLPVPRSWFGDVQGKSILCLASGGGQQAPILAAAGADVVTFDLSEEQLDRDRYVADRDGLSLRYVRGDMADLSSFANEQFDLIFHPASNVFVPDVLVVWKECARVLRPGGALLSGFMNPALFMFDHEEAERSGELVARHRLPYSDVETLDPAALQRRLDSGEPVEYSHSLDSLIGGQLEVGLAITGFYEDTWFDDSWLFAEYCPTSMATLAVKAAGDVGERPTEAVSGDGQA